MILDYIDAAMRTARYELVKEDGAFYGEIPACQGVYAHAPSLEACRDELREILEEWLLVRIRRDLAIPAVNGLTIAVKKVA